LPSSEVLPLAAAALRVFAAHADRKNRSTARLRHVRQRMGDAAFAALLDQAFQEAKAEREWPRIELATVAAGFDCRVPLNFPNGDLSPQEAEAVAGFADRPDVRVRIDNHQRVILAARDDSSLRGGLAEAPSLGRCAQPQATIVACPGRRWCKFGLIDTAALADRLRRESAGKLPEGILVGISGCPNQCAHSAVADIGVTGGRSVAEGQSVEKCTVWAGGGRGCTSALSQPVATGLSAEQAVTEVFRLASVFPRRS
jgi:sulfite reductase beta subunit-like hemoprotein